MPNLNTVRRAQEKMKRLQYYVDLADNYAVDTLDKFIIKDMPSQIVLRKSQGY